MATLFKHVGLEHRVVGHAAHRKVVASENMRIVFQVMPDFLLLRVFDECFHLRQHPVAIELVGRARIVVRDRNVGGFAGFDSQRNSYQFRFHVVDARRLGIDRDQLRRRDLLHPAREGLLRQHRFEFSFRDAYVAGCSSPSACAQLLQQAAQLEA